MPSLQDDALEVKDEPLANTEQSVKNIGSCQQHPKYTYCLTVYKDSDLIAEHRFHPNGAERQLVLELMDGKCNYHTCDSFVKVDLVPLPEIVTYVSEDADTAEPSSSQVVNSPPAVPSLSTEDEERKSTAASHDEMMQKRFITTEAASEEEEEVVPSNIELADAQPCLNNDSSCSGDDHHHQPPPPKKKRVFANVPEYSTTSVSRTPISAATSSATCDYTELCQKIEELKRFIVKSNELRDKALKQLHKELVECREEVKLLRKCLRKSEGQSFTDASNLPALPIKTMEDIEQMEKVLCTEEEKCILVNKLSVIGGWKIRSVISNMMNHVLDSKVAVHFSFHGRKNKKSFKDFKIYLCILEACKRNPVCKELHPSEINKFISLNLIYAKDRLQKKTVLNKKTSALPWSQVTEIEEEQHAENRDLC